jgi:hypothetical protein
MEWIVEAESIGDLLNGRYTVATKPVIRCKDCRYNTGLSEFIKDYYCCDYHEHIVSADDFCSYAERWEEGGK